MLRAKWAFLAASAALLQAQHGPPQFLEGDTDEIVMQRGSRVWRVDLSTLIRNNDCSWPYVNQERVCQGRPTAPCPECPRRCVKQLAWDGRRDKLYFAIQTGTSHNNPWTIFNYSLRTRKVARFTSTWSSVLEGGVVSPDGHYLALINNAHAGMCANFSRIEVVDLWERRSAQRKQGGGADDVEEIGGLRGRPPPCFGTPGRCTPTRTANRIRARSARSRARSTSSPL
jgi:hypothetical protein